MNRRALIVEDEAIIADELEWRLSQEGCSIIRIAASGEEALLMIENAPPEIILMDVQLQGQMNDIETAKLIHSRFAASVIFATAFPDLVLGSFRSKDAPPICVSKPFSAVQLRAALAQTGIKGPLSSGGNVE